jgi:hypothetical protein
MGENKKSKTTIQMPSYQRGIDDGPTNGTMPFSCTGFYNDGTGISYSRTTASSLGYIGLPNKSFYSRMLSFLFQYVLFKRKG